MSFVTLIDICFRKAVAGYYAVAGTATGLEQRKAPEKARMVNSKLNIICTG